MKFLFESNEKMNGTYFLWENRINVYNKKELPDNININQILDNISSILPSKFLSSIDSIYVGEFDSLKKREVDSVYQDGAIYVVPSYIINQEELRRNIIHEIAHSVEEENSLEIYGDSKDEQEFIRKRMILLDRLESLGYDVPEREVFFDSDYTPELDMYFYKEVGYPLMSSITSGIFSSPYGATSLREYFANSFEEYYLGDTASLKKMSPKAYEKINKLSKEEENFYGRF